METEKDVKELLTALCKAQAEYPDIPKTRTGQEGNRKFKYADLNDIHKATRQINAKYGLSTPHETNDTHLITRLFHAPSGQSLSTALPIKLTENPKHTGATLTYLKRYNIQSLLDISTEEDLDSIDLSKGKDESQPQGQASPPKGKTNAPLVSEPQLKRLFAISNANGWTHDQCKNYISLAWDLESTKDLDREKYDHLISTIEKQSFEEAAKAFPRKAMPQDEGEMVPLLVKIVRFVNEKKISNEEMKTLIKRVTGTEKKSTDLNNEELEAVWKYLNMTKSGVS